MAKLSKAERSRIAKKAWNKRKRGGKVTRRKTTTPKARRRKYTRRKGGLSEMITSVQANKGLRAGGLGALGGGLASLAEKVFKPDMPENEKIMWLGAGAFVLATVGKAPYMASGVAGIVGYKLMTEVGLSEGAHEYADPIERLPEVLDENGRPMTLSEDPTTGNIYLNEGNELYLDENDPESYQVEYAPDFAGDWSEHQWDEL